MNKSPEKEAKTVVSPSLDESRKIEQEKKNEEPKQISTTSKLANSGSRSRTLNVVNARLIRKVQKPRPLKPETTKALLEDMERKQHDRRMALAAKLSRLLEKDEQQKKVLLDDGSSVAETNQETGEAKETEISAEDVAKLEQRDRKMTLAAGLSSSSMPISRPAKKEEPGTGPMSETRECEKLLEKDEQQKKVLLDDGSSVAETNQETGEAKETEISAEDVAKLEQRDRKMTLAAGLSSSSVPISRPAKKEEPGTGPMSETRECEKLLEKDEQQKKVLLDDGSSVAETNQETGEAKETEISAEDVAKLKSSHGLQNYRILQVGTKSLYVAADDANLVEEIITKLKAAWEKDEPQQP